MRITSDFEGRCWLHPLICFSQTALRTWTWVMTRRGRTSRRTGPTTSSATARRRKTTHARRAAGSRHEAPSGPPCRGSALRCVLRDACSLSPPNMCMCIYIHIHTHIYIYVDIYTYITMLDIYIDILDINSPIPLDIFHMYIYTVKPL